MRLTILGTGSALPDPRRAQSGFLLEQAERLVLIDCGSGVFQRLAQLSVDWAKLDTILLTHHHLDHMSDLLSMLIARWLLGFPQANVYGPEGTPQLLRQLLASFPYVRDHISLLVQELQAHATYNIAGLEVSTFPMTHYIPTLAYKFDNKLALCGDGEPAPKLKEFVRGCQLVVHECSLPDTKRVPLHATPTALGQALAGAEIEWLLLTHLFPKIAESADEVIRAVQKGFPGRVSLAADLQIIKLT